MGGKEGFNLAQSLRVQPITVGTACWQEREVISHMARTARMQGETNAGPPQLAFPATQPGVIASRRACSKFRVSPSTSANPA